uniref:CCT-gamma n=1 Tax=Biomphalaria glabrata TaxID=6526 RepID=A0A2C9K6T4_BIOGL
KMCKEIIALKPDLVITEKGVSDLAQHYLVKENISVIRRVRKSDNNRIARACGANIANRTDELKEEDIGTGCGLFEIQKIGDEIISYVFRMFKKFLDPTVLQALNERAKSITGVHQWPYRAISRALEVIPRTLVQNCGANCIRTLTSLRAKHSQPNNTSWGIDGTTGNLVDMKTFGVWEPISVKQQVYKTAIETAILLLRIDDIVSGVKKQGSGGAAAAPQGAQPAEGAEQ